MATQAYCNTSFGPEGLALMEQGASAQEALAQLVAGDEGRIRSQVMDILREKFVPQTP